MIKIKGGNTLNSFNDARILYIRKVSNNITGEENYSQIFLINIG
jgi:hypothetical protein